MMDNSFRECLAEIKLVATDCDGVLTDGGLYYTNNGMQIKKFNVLDGEGFRLLREAGIMTAIISGDSSPLLQARAEKLKLDFLMMGRMDKREALLGICRNMGIKLSESAYLGDDGYDIPAMQASGIGVCPHSAWEKVRAAADLITERNGGEGCFREFVEILLAERSKAHMGANC